MKNITAKIVAIALVAMLLVPVVGGTAAVWAKTEDELAKQLQALLDSGVDGQDIEALCDVDGVEDISIDIDDDGKVTVTYGNNATKAMGDKVSAEAAKLKPSGSGEGGGKGILGDAVGTTAEDAAKEIDDITGSLALSANMETGQKLITPKMQELIATFIGGLTIAILTLIGLFTAVDIFYLVVPPLHTALEEGAAAKGQTDKNGNPKPRIVSKDACDAYNEGTENQKNVIITYLKKRIVAYIAVAVVVFLLLTGQMSKIITTVLSLISGVLESVFG